MLKIAFRYLIKYKSRSLFIMLSLIISMALLSFILFCGFSLMSDLLSSEVTGLIPAEEFLRLLSFSFNIVMALIFLAAVFLIANSFLINVEEQRQMSGVLTSIGATRGQTTKIILYQSTLLSTPVVPAGIGLGMLGAYIFTSVIMKSKDFRFLSERTPDFRCHLLR